MAKPSSPPAKLLFTSLLAISFLSLTLFFLSKTTPLHPPNFSPATGLHNPFPPQPRIAYVISGSGGDGLRVVRLLYAVYHPRNRYLLHLDRRALQVEREELAVSVASVDAFRAAGNVDVVGKADFVNFDGSSAVAADLRGAAILVRRWKDWDWFVNLAASDYPLISQDEFLHVLSFLPRDFNFITHTSHIGWKEYQRMLRIIIDPGLYRASKSEIFYGSCKLFAKCIQDFHRNIHLWTLHIANVREYKGVVRLDPLLTGGWGVAQCATPASEYFTYLWFPVI